VNRFRLRRLYSWAQDAWSQGVRDALVERTEIVLHGDCSPAWQRIWDLAYGLGHAEAASALNLAREFDPLLTKRRDEPHVAQEIPTQAWSLVLAEAMRP
jgi:hypothetical protein